MRDAPNPPSTVPPGAASTSAAPAAGAREGGGADAAGPLDPAEGADGLADFRSSATLDAAFEHLLGRQATDGERLHLRRLQEKLGIGSNDAIWLIFVALDYYATLYQQIPQAMRRAVKAVLVEYKEQADATLAQAVQALEERTRQLQDALQVEAAGAATASRRELATAIQQAARRIALKAAFGARWPWWVGGAASLALVLVLAIGIALGYGRHAGYAAGYTAGHTVAIQQSLAPAPIPHRLPAPTQSRGR